MLFFFIKCLALYQISVYSYHNNLQHMDNSLETDHQLNSNALKLASDFMEDQFELYTLHNMQYKKHNSFVKFFILLSGDI